MSIRHLILILGDHLHTHHPALFDVDPAQDRVLMIEAVGEGTRVWSHKARIVLFLSAMRHYAERLRGEGLKVDYLGLEDPECAAPALVERLGLYLARHTPARLTLVEAGEWHLAQAIETTAARSGVPLNVLQDPHFLCAHQEFQAWARGRKRLLMENFYRMLRKREGVLMDGDQPAGGTWNFDHENRKAFGAKGPSGLPVCARTAPDALTTRVMALVERQFPDHPGSLARFDWPVTREDALGALQDFIRERLPRYGDHQDAMWAGEPYLFHSLISSALNLKLLDPREVIAAAEAHWRAGLAPLAAVEGFIRQVLGWREFIRGVYWLDMPGMAEANEFGHERPLPSWFWTGQTRMNCMREVIGTTLAHGYAHHIQRLMITGLFGLTAEIRPKEVAAWYLAAYVDAVEWVELPNVMGMALFANGGRFTSKPYAASGAYVKRMSNYCKACCYKADQRTGPEACPLTQLYWNFIDRHHVRLAAEPRTALMAKNLERIPGEERRQIRAESALRLARLEDL